MRANKHPCTVSSIKFDPSALSLTCKQLRFESMPFWMRRQWFEARNIDEFEQWRQSCGLSSFYQLPRGFDISTTVKVRKCIPGTKSWNLVSLPFVLRIEVRDPTAGIEMTCHFDPDPKSSDTSPIYLTPGSVAEMKSYFRDRTITRNTIELPDVVPFLRWLSERTPDDAAASHVEEGLSVITMGDAQRFWGSNGQRPYWTTGKRWLLCLLESRAQV
jgi:hypothetical protein